MSGAGKLFLQVQVHVGDCVSDGDYGSDGDSYGSYGGSETTSNL